MKNIFCKYKKCKVLNAFNQPILNIKIPNKKIAIWGLPRSGTSWLGQIFNSSVYTLYRFQPLFSYQFKNRISLSSKNNDIEKLIIDVVNTDNKLIIDGIGPKKELNLLNFDKVQVPTHLVMKHVRYIHLIETFISRSENIKVIAIVRHPCATINSWLRCKNEFLSKWDISEEWEYANKKNNNKDGEYFGFNKWKEGVEIFEKLASKYPNRFYLQHYSELLRDPFNEVRKLFQFSELKLCSQVLKFIERSTSIQFEDDYSVFKCKKKDNNWKQQLPSFIIEKIENDLIGTNYEKYMM